MAGVGGGAGRVSARGARVPPAYHPRALLGVAPQRLEVGKAADVVLFDHGPGEPFALLATVVGGRVWLAGGHAGG